MPPCSRFASPILASPTRCVYARCRADGSTGLPAPMPTAEIMFNLAVAAVFLIGTHFGIASTPLRGELIGRVGENGYRALYSLLALVALVWLATAWRAAPHVPLWDAGAGLRHLALALTPLSFLLVVCAVTTTNPTVVGQNPDPDA